VCKKLRVDTVTYPDYADWGRPKILGGNRLVTGHRTQLSIAITDSATAIKISVHNNAASGTSRIFFIVCTPIVTFWGYISHK